MGSFFTKLVITLILSAVAAAAYVYFQAGDPIYALRESLNGGAWSRYDAAIKKAAADNQIDPRLIKAVVWRESRFGAHKNGAHGERGLMQITEIAAKDYAIAKGIKNFNPNDLYKPEVNLEVGSWYLKRALDHYKDRESPLPFALSEYNAGRSRVTKWIGDPQKEVPTSAEEMKQKSYDSTRAYVEAIEQRYEFYKRRGNM